MGSLNPGFNFNLHQVPLLFQAHNKLARWCFFQNQLSTGSRLQGKAGGGGNRLKGGIGSSFPHQHLQGMGLWRSPSSQWPHIPLDKEKEGNSQEPLTQWGRHTKRTMGYLFHRFHTLCCVSFTTVPFQDPALHTPFKSPILSCSSKEHGTLLGLGNAIGCAERC